MSSKPELKSKTVEITQQERDDLISLWNKIVRGGIPSSSVQVAISLTKHIDKIFKAPKS